MPISDTALSEGDNQPQVPGTMPDGRPLDPPIKLPGEPSSPSPPLTPPLERPGNDNDERRLGLFRSK